MHKRFFAAGVAGGLELCIFHPIDTVAKRLMNNRDQAALNKVIFRDAAEKPLTAKFRSLFPGFGFAAGYKVSQRVYKFGSQPVVRDAMPKWESKLLREGVAGAIVGMGEVALLPLDVLKIRMQTNPQFFADKGLGQLVKEEGLAGLYAGWNWTMARNAPGSFMLFGVNSGVKDLLGVRDRKATVLETFVSSAAGGCASVFFVCPLDVIKTRLQSGTYQGSGFEILTSTMREEGIGAFWKGAVPKVCTVAPKLVFSFTVAQCLTDYLTK